MSMINETIFLKLFQWSCELLQNESQAFHKSFSVNDTNYTLTSSIFSCERDGVCQRPKSITC